MFFKLILSIFLIHNLFLFFRTFKFNKSEIDNVNLKKNIQYYQNKDINKRVLSNRVARALLKEKSILAKKLIYNLIICPTLCILEIIVLCMMVNLEKTNILLYVYLITIGILDILYFYNSSSIWRDRFYLILKLIILISVFFI